MAITVKKEVEGFILNRLQAALLLESWRLVTQDYVSVEDLDRTRTASACAGRSWAR